MHATLFSDSDLCRFEKGRAVRIFVFSGDLAKFCDSRVLPHRLPLPGWLRFHNFIAIS